MNSRDLQSELPDTTASVPDGVRVYAIGDIHGRSDLLERQHALIDADYSTKRSPVVHLVYLGDYVDRGPDSFNVVERLAEGPISFVNVALLRGNHEEMLLRFLDDPSVGPIWRRLGGLETLLSYGIDVEKVLKENGYPGLSEHFKSRLPAHHHALFSRLEPSMTIGDYFFCHAGVRPGIPLDQQKPDDLLWIRDEFLDASHDFGKVIVHGHTPVEQPTFGKNRINIDTGAYATGRLTCLVLEGRSSRIIST
jgi:serine/threonine protein phosphatase 1